jgi:hypothetical protein
MTRPPRVVALTRTWRYARSEGMGYLLIIAISAAVGVAVYRWTGTMAVAAGDPEMWAGAGPAPPEQAQAPAPPPTNFERLSITRDRLTWHDRIVGTLGLVVVVAVGATSLAFAVYLVASAILSLVEKAAGP